jgi:hypothetical protein
MHKDEVELMQHFLPHAAYQFFGGRNSNHLAVVFELLQAIH